MTPQPFLLRLWLLATRLFSIPIAALAKRAHHRMGADPGRVRERLGHPGMPSQTGVIWFHAASLGEVMQIGRLARTVAEARGAPILVTTGTASGADWVAREMPFALHQFSPADTAPAVRRFLDAWAPEIAIFVEGDLWPGLLSECDKRGIPRALVNARHSRTRARFPKVFASLLGSFALITCRSQQVADGLLSLGLQADRVQVLPDLKAASAALAAPDELRTPLAEAIGSRPVWLAASTHPEDEAPVLGAHQKVLAQSGDALLVIAPRHPQRGGPLEETATARRLTTARRSTGQTISADINVYIADTLGELGLFFSLAPVAFVGGSFGPQGGHTPYEPARFGTAIVTGPGTRNFEDAYTTLIERGAAVQVADSADLAETILRLLATEKHSEMGREGRSFMDECDDGVSQHAELLIQLLRNKA